MGKKLRALLRKMAIGACIREPANPKSRRNFTVSELQYIDRCCDRYIDRCDRYIDRCDRDCYIDRCDCRIEILSSHSNIEYLDLRTKLGFLKQNSDIEDFDLYAELIFLQFNCLCRVGNKNINIILQKVESIYFPWEQLRDIKTWRRTYRSSNSSRLCLRLLLHLFIPIIECLELLSYICIYLCILLFLLPSVPFLLLKLMKKWMARVWSNKIQRKDLVVGDHIYTWMRAHTYAHHGIYIGDGKVIHYTRGGSKKRIMFSSSPSHPLESTSAIGSDQSRLDRVVITGIDDFLSGGELYHFKYDVSLAHFIANPRGGTCTLSPSSPFQVVQDRLSYHLKNGFGDYHLFKNNCEDFAIYCKTGFHVADYNFTVGRSGQAASFVVAIIVFISSTMRFSGTRITGLNFIMGYGIYSACRLASDIGVRRNIRKAANKKLAKESSGCLRASFKLVPALVKVVKRHVWARFILAFLWFCYQMQWTSGGINFLVGWIILSFPDGRSPTDRKPSLPSRKSSRRYSDFKNSKIQFGAADCRKSFTRYSDIRFGSADYSVVDIDFTAYLLHRIFIDRLRWLAYLLAWIHLDILMWRSIL